MELLDGQTAGGWGGVVERAGDHRMAESPPLPAFAGHRPGIVLNGGNGFAMLVEVALAARIEAQPLEGTEFHPSLAAQP